MKAFIYILLFLLSFTAIAQKARVEAVYYGAYYSLIFPYNGQQPILFMASNLDTSKVYNMVIPTNYDKYFGQGYELATRVSSDSKGNLIWVFNDKRDPVYYEYMNPIWYNRWNLPGGVYEFQIYVPGGKKVCQTEFKVQ